MKIKIKKNGKNIVKRIFIDVLAVILSAFLAALSLNSFIIPNRFVSGGVGGIATILEASGIMKSYIALIVMNAPLLIASLIFLKKDFAIKTIACSLLVSLIMGLMDKYNFMRFTDDRLLASLISGILYGLSTGIIYENGGSTGGSEIVANLIVKRNPDAKITILILIMDVIIMLAGLLVFDAWSVVYAIICAFSGERTMAFYINRGSLGGIFYIISDKPDKIKETFNEIFKTEGLEIEATGTYTKKEKSLFKIILPYSNKRKFKDALKAADDKAFSFVAFARVINKVKNESEITKN